MESLADYLNNRFSKAIVYTFSIAWVLLISIIILVSYFSTKDSLIESLENSSRQVTSYIFDRNLGQLNEYFFAAIENKTLASIKVISKENSEVIFEAGQSSSSPFPKMCRLNSSSEIVNLYGCTEIVSVKVLVVTTLALFFYAAALYFAYVLSRKKVAGALIQLSEGLTSALEERETIFSFKILELDQLREKLASRSRELIALGEKAIHIEVSRKVAHDLRSPLGIMENIVRQKNLSKDDFEILLKSVNFLQNISRDLLDVTKSNLYPCKERVALKELLLDVIALKKNQKNCSRICFEVNVDIEACLWVNRTNFIRAISNIIENSIEALTNAETALIKISTTYVSGGIHLCIEDSGMGFPEEILKSFQDSIPLSTKLDGNGIGLMSAEKMLVDYGGRLEIRNSSNRGAVVNVQIPKDHVLKRCTPIILIDDDKYLRLSWEKVGREAGYNVLTFASYGEFSDKVDLLDINSEVFLDYHLGEELGANVVDKILSCGFNKLNFATGESIDEIRKLNGLNSVKGKTFPY